MSTGENLLIWDQVVIKKYIWGFFCWNII